MSTNYFDNKTAFLEPQVTQYGSRMVMTNVTKPRKTKLVNIDTRFIEDVTKSAEFYKVENYTISLPERITEVTSIKVTQIDIPMTIFNISASLGNNYFHLMNLTTMSMEMVTIPDGNYDLSNIMNRVSNCLPDDVDFYIKEDYVFLINNTNTRYRIDFAIDQIFSVDKNYMKSKIGWMMGFRNKSYILKCSKSVKAESIMSLNTIRYLYLVIDEFSTSFPNSFCSVFSDSVMNKKILAKIVMNNTIYPFGTILNGNEENAILISDKRIYSGKTDLQKLNIQLVNEVGKSVDLNGIDFSFILKIEHE
jgi:hypothetical protein